MKMRRLKRTRSAERRKVDLAVKYRDQGKASGGGYMNVKKVRRTLEARNLPLQRKPSSPVAGKKQRAGRRRAT